MKKLKNYLPQFLKKKIKTILYGEIHGGLRPFFKNLDVFIPYIKEKQTIIEIGSERDAGSSYFLARLCDKYNLNFITIDPNKETSDSVQIMLNQFQNNNFKAVNKKGEDFLANYNNKDIFFAYLDGFDVVIPGIPHKQSTIDAYKKDGIDLLKDGNKISAQVHLETAIYVEKNLVNGGVIGFDDTWTENKQWYGKGMIAVPYLLEKGYTIINLGKRDKISRSIILQKSIDSSTKNG